MHIPFISDITDDGSTFEIPGLSILAAQNNSSASEKSWRTKEREAESTGSELTVKGSYKAATEVMDVTDSNSQSTTRNRRDTVVAGSSVNKNNDVSESLKTTTNITRVDKCRGVKSDGKLDDDEFVMSGSKVEEIHLTGEEEEEEEEEETAPTEMKIDDVEDDVGEGKAEDAFGSKVEEVKFTEEELREMERKRQQAEEEKTKRNKEVVDQRLKSFTHLHDNLYLTEKRKSKRSKEVRRMVCDCSLSKEELVRGDEGCGDDCLNRLLMIECGSRCPLKDRCTNKRFQNREYGDVEVFNADEKGCGLRARTHLSPGTFIMEYVGEVFDMREFKRRRKEYARDHSAHFYFMALKSDQLIDATRKGNVSRFINHSCDPNAETQKSDQLIDATRKGNVSRFINHSCDPNAETQKWTVNGELRVGFFSKKQITAGDEINFDYRLERYGREPQRCYCGTSLCRGWLGEAPDEKTKEEKDEERRKEERDRRKREERRAFFEDIDLEDEIEKLNSHKLRNRQDTLNLSRLLVRVEDYSGRTMLLQLLQTGEAACRRLFLDYHGLKVLWSLMADLTLARQHTLLKMEVLWSLMADLTLARQHTLLKMEILKTLECLPITNKTQLTDSRVLALVERWSIQQQPDPSTTTTSSTTSLPPPPPPPPPPVAPPPPTTVAIVESSDSDTNKKSSDTSEESDSEVETKATHNTLEASSADDSSMDSEVEQPPTVAAVSGKRRVVAAAEVVDEEESSDSNHSDGKESNTTTTTTAATTVTNTSSSTSKEGLKEDETASTTTTTTATVTTAAITVTTAAETTVTTAAATGVNVETDALEKKKEKELQELQDLHNSMVTLALKLLDNWKNLKEFFRIPKKERIEMMKEHEREVDRGYKEYLDREQDSDRDCERDRKDKDRDSWYSRRDYYDRRRRSPDRDKDRGDRGDRHPRTRNLIRDDRTLDSPKMSKEQRRQLFELKVQQEEEEAKQRKMQEEMWAMHVDRCRHLGHDPYLTPIFDPTYQYYWDPTAASWQPYTAGSGNTLLRHSVPIQADPNIPVPAGYGQQQQQQHNDGEGGSPLTLLLPGQPQGTLLLPGQPQGALHMGHHLPPGAGTDDPLNPANIPLPGEIPALSQASPSQPLPGQAVPCEGTPPQGAKVLSIPLPGEISNNNNNNNTVIQTQMEKITVTTTLDGDEDTPPPPPAPPGPVTLQLPPRWKIARDTRGHVYFYHVKTRTSQWDPPTLDRHNQLMAELLGSDSDSDTSSSDTSSSDTSDSEDFSSEEEEEEVVETVTRSEVSDGKMIRRVRGKKRRSEALVQERVISPIMEIDREAARRERREAKERAREEARQERQEEQQQQQNVQQQKDRLEASDSSGEGPQTKPDRYDNTNTTSSSSGGGGSGSGGSSSSSSSGGGGSEW
ncbi:hypothetical protein Pcinc_030719 [Petrolisthes cinctipes]|uniref:Histone-lysine N-methyltransferase SETD2 n=1 Tax=Petrolisthes cinctipes TaxID=88211 RepID=A0AAE1EXU7_PETCI|nr:hypothetical protein Pcinc_030719 [Petrolisthes cinctipes]